MTSVHLSDIEEKYVAIFSNCKEMPLFRAIHTKIGTKNAVSVAEHTWLRIISTKSSAIFRGKGEFGKLTSVSISKNRRGNFFGGFVHLTGIGDELARLRLQQSIQSDKPDRRAIAG